jgi:hypothetical protein
MATQIAHLDLQIAHFNNFRKYNPKLSKLDQHTIDVLLKDNYIEVSSAFEKTVALVGKYDVISESHADLSDGSDCKLSTVYGDGRVYVGQVTGFKHKTGKLRVQLYERITNKFYYFVIPYHWYNDMVKIKIPFTFNGVPKRDNKWWNLEVKTFEELASL